MITEFSLQFCRSQWSGLRRGSAAARLLGIPGSNRAGEMDVCLLLSVVCRQVEVAATSRPLVERNTDCGVSLCVI